MKNFKKVTTALLLAVCTTLFFSCKKKDDVKPMTPSETLASTFWLTTDAKNNKGEKVALTDANVVNFVGFAYFKADGTFTMYNLDDSPKMHGDWTVPADGKTRTIVAKDANGAVLFTRVVDITVLTKMEFTYRVYPNAADKTVYFDIIHTPTTHAEPKK
ncbi:uncharacterized protein DUF4822 [Chitinophaga dinghuensis]|uniref:Uncharacterized protein DUF4822 n=1 Tax=Chitinophaga dinghuensis TaxID=1539050 RepID=A0A327WD86_9BACT|nr:DUF4822 domain-containing protein [Chitinophaga dinghuensis]RAJ87872.1 uncharacterized protein DUF4822 [Chitinophaga dinghuensis]